MAPHPPAASAPEPSPDRHSRAKKDTGKQMDFQFRLVSVAFKEAALDSPSFRATTTTFNSQLANTEAWFKAVTGSFLKADKKIEDFSSIFAITDFMAPVSLHDSLVDPAYCLKGLQKSSQALTNLWKSAFDSFRIDPSKVTNNNQEFLKRVSRFKSFRRKFLHSQEKYDRYFSIHMSTPKFKEAGLLLEDSLQLADARQEYLQDSLDLVVEMYSLVDFINYTIITLNESYWKEKRESVRHSYLNSESLDSVVKSVSRLRCWYDFCQKANAKFSRDLLSAKKTIQDHASEIHAPSTSVDDYKPNLINSRLLANTKEDSVEKYGYLCMKTYVEKSTKPIWVKRWTFVKNGVLGFFVLKPGYDLVQETDKIGVLLCNVKYTPNEDRLFCFEVKTKDTSIVLQAETLSELKSWLKVFDNAKKRIVDADDPLNGLLPDASNRYPPQFLEFTTSCTTSTDRALTTKHISDSFGNQLKSVKLSKHLEKIEGSLKRSVYGFLESLHFPIVTSSTTTAIIGSNVSTAHPTYPTALTANSTGSVNWGLESMLEQREVNPRLTRPPDEPLAPSRTKHVGLAVLYPYNFPNQWLAHDLQLRALFETEVNDAEFCLLSYHCLLSPNEDQEFQTTHFITQTNIYSYIHSLGFVSMSKIPFTNLVEANSHPMGDYDLVKLNFIFGSLSLKLFFDNATIIERKLNFLVQNNARDSPLGICDIISGLLDIEAEFEAEKKSTPVTQSESTSKKFIEEVPTGTNTKGISFSSEKLTDGKPLLAKRTFNLPAKAAFHVLCGSESEILNKSATLIDIQFSERNLWCKPTSGTSYLKRDNLASYTVANGHSGKYKVTQEIEVAVDDEFYSIHIAKSAMRLKNGCEITITNRITIRRLEGERCIVKVHGQTHISGPLPLTFILRRVCHVFNVGFAHEVLKEVDIASNIIGAKGKLVRAVYFYGKILVANEPYKELEFERNVLSRTTVLRLYLQLTVAAIVRSFMDLWYLVYEGVKLIFSQAVIHAVLIGIILVLVVMNTYLGGVSTVHFWNARNSKKVIQDILHVEPLKFERAVYSQDVKDLVNDKLAFSKNSSCFRVFRNNSVVLNHGSGRSWNGMVQGTLASRVDALRDTLHGIAIKRNDLLVNLVMLNKMEEEIAKTEWRTWLMNELTSCELMREMALSSKNGSGNGGAAESEVLQDSMAILNEYCDSCAQEVDGLSGIL